MHPDRVIVRTYIQSYSLSMIPDNLNALTRHSACTNDTPRNLLHGPVTDVGSNSHLFTNISIFTYIIPVKCNVQNSNGIKAPVNVFGLVMIKFHKQTLLNHQRHHTIYHKILKTPSFKLHSNITINSELNKLKISDGNKLSQTQE